MRDMLSMQGLKAQDLQGLSPEAVTALAAQMLEHIRQQANELQSKGRELQSKGHELELKQKLIERKERDIAWRDAKLEKITFELARLKRWKYGAKSEAMDAEQRQMFQGRTRPISRHSSLHCRLRCPRLRPSRRRLLV